MKFSIFVKRTIVYTSLSASVLALAACEDAPPLPPPPRPVRVIEILPEANAMRGENSGRIEARYTSNVGFLVGGRMISRDVDVGTTVKSGDLLARIDPVDYQNKLSAAEAEVTAAQADIDQAQPQEERFRKLLSDGFATQANYDQALRALQNARAKMQGAQANLRLARDQLNYARLTAPTDGVVTKTGAETGQVVQPGQMIVQIAQIGEREAVFAVSGRAAAAAHPGIPVTVSLQDNPRISVTGSIREIAPNADAVTGTYAIRVSLPDAPEDMRLGSIVVGRAEIAGDVVVRIPATALLQIGDKPQVWVVSAENIVKRRPVTVLRYDTNHVLLADGVTKGELVVAAGVNSLTEGQKIVPQKVSAP